jgi:predicted alpha/beta superfamily hydrolase
LLDGEITTRRRPLTGVRVAKVIMRITPAVLVFLAACGYDPKSVPGDDDELPPVEEPVDEGCPDGKAGAACILALYDAAIDCDPGAIATLRDELDQRAELGPLWASGRALFRTDAPRAVAGSFNDWSTTAVVTAPLCGSDLILGVGTVATGYHQYKLYDAATSSWTLDPHDPAFAYDDFAGNLDGRNSVLATPDSGRGYTVTFGETCSTTLGNCREVTAYLPAGYDALEAKDRTYPVLFMHDGQNLWSDHDCCFGHTGWELDAALDTEIGEGRVAPVIVIGAASTTSRNIEYGLDRTTATAFMEFQIDELQPKALANVRWDGERLGIGGSSLGGLTAMDLALAYPDTYAAAVSLSGAFWPGMEAGDALRDRIPTYGKQPVAIYLDHGGSVATNSDGAADSVEVRDELMNLGWSRSDSPSCTASPSTVCYHSEPGATHDELAWKARTWRFLRYLYPL